MCYHLFDMYHYCPSRLYKLVARCQQGTTTLTQTSRTQAAAEAMEISETAARMWCCRQLCKTTCGVRQLDRQFTHLRKTMKTVSSNLVGLDRPQQCTATSQKGWTDHNSVLPLHCRAGQTTTVYCHFTVGLDRPQQSTATSQKGWTDHNMYCHFTVWLDRPQQCTATSL